MRKRAQAHLKILSTKCVKKLYIYIYIYIYIRGFAIRLLTMVDMPQNLTKPNYIYI